MKTKELNKLSAEFSEFLSEKHQDLESQMREFYFAKFGCNNAEREAELLDYWLKH